MIGLMDPSHSSWQISPVEGSPTMTSGSFEDFWPKGTRQFTRYRTSTWGELSAFSIHCGFILVLGSYNSSWSPKKQPMVISKENWGVKSWNKSGLRKNRFLNSVASQQWQWNVLECFGEQNRSLEFRVMVLISARPRHCFLARNQHAMPHNSAKFMKHMWLWYLKIGYPIPYIYIHTL